MPFRYQWDDNRRVLHYVAEGDWNWRDYHVAVRVATFSFTGTEDAVDVVVDLRGSTRQQMPTGMLGHMRMMGKRVHPSLTGRAALIGMPTAERQKLNLVDNQLPTPDGFVQFVEDETDLDQVLALWQSSELR